MSSSDSQEPTVFLVDDDEAVRDSMRWLVESVGLKIETFSSGQIFLESFDPERPGCLITDMRMPGMGGLELQEQLRRRGSAMPVIIVTAFGDVQTAVRAMKGGAVDFLQKPYNNDQVLELIQRSIAKDQEERQRRGELQLVEEGLQRLTPREREVLQLVVGGHSNKEIARELGIVPKTVEAHRAQVMDKMGVRSLADLVRRFSEYQLDDSSGEGNPLA